MITDGLVLYLPFYHPELQGSPIISRDSYAHSCTVTGALWTPQGRNFDVADASIAVGSASDTFIGGLSQASLEAWFTPSIVIGQPHWIMGRGNYITGVGYFLYQAAAVLRMDMEFTTAGVQDFAFNTTLVAGQWYHVFVVFDGSNLIYYVNGQLDKTSAIGVDTIKGSTLNVLSLGKRSDSASGWFNGKIGEVRIYNRALILAEIERNYSATKIKYATYWDYFSWG